MPQIPGVEFVDNTNQRTPCVLLLDISGSMTGEPIRQLNEGLKAFEEELKSDPVAALRVQVMVITVGGPEDVRIVQPWTDASDFKAPTLHASGLTPLGQGMAKSLDEIASQKAVYDANGISSTRPWIIMISDGCPNDYGWESYADQSRQEEQDKRVIVFPIGTKDADFEALGRFSVKTPKKLKGLQFRELFVWLSRSMSTVSASVPGEKVSLPATDSWAEIEV
ncbi:MAG TPA: VWA domain-containing protein [Marinobacter sp.]|nr:VWA domain-containing protein [Marinobacter sp.]